MIGLGGGGSLSWGRTQPRLKPAPAISRMRIRRLRNATAAEGGHLGGDRGGDASL